MNRQDSLKLDLDTQLNAASPREAVAVCVYQQQVEFSGTSGSLLKTIARLLADGDFLAKEDETLELFASGNSIGGDLWRLFLFGMGAHAAAAADSRLLRRVTATAVRQARAARVQHLSFVLPVCINDGVGVRAVAEGATLGAYDNDFYSQDDEETPTLKRFTIVVPETRDELRAAVERARIVAESVNWARALTDEPGGYLPPREFARRAAKMAAEFNLRVETLAGDEIKARGMGGLWGVGQGSDEPPAMIVVRYEPAEDEGTNSANDELWAFVGKGITFDTGGISLKPAARMEEMKADMAGGAAVLGALRALAQLNCRRRIVGIVPSAENMPSGGALKPGDVVRTLAGYTIECVDTDAEGRLVLADGIAYARQLGAARIIDLATLTGSIIVALGDHRAGLFSNDDCRARQVLAAAERADEPSWRMPVSDDYQKKIESPIADFKNYGGRPDAIGAALLLSKFAADTPWVHLDIAATAWHDDSQPHAPKGATGAGVRTLVELACEET